MRPALLAAVLALLPSAGVAAADPVLDWYRTVYLAPADQPGPGGAPAPAPVKPAEPVVFLGDVAGPARPVGLPELIQLTVRQSPSLAQAKLDIEAAEAEIARAQAWADWAMTAELQASSRQLQQFEGRSDQVSLSAGLTRALTTGGTVGLSATGDWSRFPGFGQEVLRDAGGNPILDPGTGQPLTRPVEVTRSEYTEAITATFTQPLLEGRGKAQVLAAERIARSQRQAAEVAEEAAAISVVREVVLGYFALVAAERDLEIRRASLDLAKERLRVTEAGIKGGGVARAELIPVEQAIATREEEAMAGELAVLEQSLALRRLVQLPIEKDQLLLASSFELAIPSQSWNQAKIIEDALATSPELARLRALEAGATIEVEVSENGMLPSLDLALQFGPSGSADGPLTAAKNMAQFDEFVASGSLRYQDTWDRTAARANARAARARRERVRVSATDVRTQIVEAVARAVAQVQVAERRYAIAARAVALAEQNVEVEQARLALGKSRNVDVLLRQDELRAAQLRSVRAIIDWHRAATAIAALTGTILPQYGIAWR